MNDNRKQPLVSVIIPVKNGGKTIAQCIRSVQRSYYRNFEIIVINDNSSDNSENIARGLQCEVIAATEGTGANNARNIGARTARGDILMFIDADIIVRRETILEIVETLEESYIDAVVGIYTARHRHESFVSQYKNLWVRYSYLKSLPAIDWLFGSISGIKREAFRKLGGFDVGLLARHGHDDIELGKRFARARLNIILNMDIEVEHLKNYNLVSFIKNEFHRSFGFSSLAVRFGETAKSFRMGFVNVYPEFVLSTLFSIFVLMALVLWLIGGLPKWYALTAVGLYLLLNIRFLNYLEQVRGLFAMIFMIPCLFLDHLVCLVGSVVGTLSGLMRGKKGTEFP
jgi:glycosyltransferase involved in cell wall biosynthesis